MATKKENEVATKENTALAAFDYGEDAGAGFDNVTSDDMAVPFINLLQANSPQCSDEDNFPDAKAGKLMNSASAELYNGKDGVVFVPCLTHHEFVEWTPRDAGGGLVGRHDVNSEVVKRAEAAAKAAGTGLKLKTPEGNDLIDTFYIYGLVLGSDPESTEASPAILAFKSMGIAAYKRMIYTLRQYQIKTPDGKRVSPPIYAHRVLLRSEKDSNVHGDFFKFNMTHAVKNSLVDSMIDPQGPQGHLIAEGRRVKDGFMSGEMQAAAEDQPATGGGNAGGDEEVPF